ncbi:MAG: CocE/NonD family hydrolase [Sphingobacteriales bacterium]
MKHFHLLPVLLFTIFQNTMAQDIDILSGIKIKTRDGVQLNATIFKPHEQKEPLPLIFTLTPYIGDSYHERGTYFSKHGYVFALVDVRGRGSSEGVFDPFVQEAKDGYDIVEWLAAQKYCNGKVTMWGGSYAGYDQWATAKELPPHLKTIVPVASVKPGVDFPMFYNISYPYIIQWLTFTNAKTGNANFFADGEFWKSKFTERYNKDIPFNKLDSLVGNPNKTFQQWVSHPFKDDYIKKMCPTVEQYGKMNFPILTITGSYDADQPGALIYYREFMQYASASAKNNHYLIIGPWDHSGTRTPKKEVGGLTFGDASFLNLNDLHRQWYDYALKDSAKPEFLKNKVAYFVTNKDKWKYVSSLEEIGKEKQSFYLNSANNKENDVLHSGFLQTTLPGVSNNPAAYIYDPLDKSPGLAEQNSSGNYLTDQAFAFRLTNNGVIYHTAPFEKETEASGFFELKAYIETDVKDMDVEADVYEIKANGTSVFLASSMIRARYRESIEQEKLLVPGEINLFDFNNFTFNSRVIEKGSRLRLIIASPNSIYAQKNYCSGGIIANETAKDAHTAHVKIYNDSKHPSVLLMPVVN